MKKKIFRIFILSAMLLLLCNVRTLSAETQEGIYSLVVLENQSVPYVIAEIEDEARISLTVPNAVYGCNYAVAVLSEQAEISRKNAVYLDQKMAQDDEVSFDIYPRKNMKSGQYHIYISSDADSGITSKTKVASFSYGLAAGTKEVYDISIKTLPGKLVYKPGEALDLTGLVLIVSYNDNTTEEIAYDGSNMTVLGFDSTKAASEQTVTVLYRSMEAAFMAGIKQTAPGSVTEPKPDTEQKQDTQQKPTTEQKQDAQQKQDAGTAEAEKNEPVFKASKTTFKAGILKKKAQKFTINVRGGSGKIKYQPMPKKYIIVSKKGVVTLKKGTPKGTYRIKATVTGANGKKTVETIKIIVK